MLAARIESPRSAATQASATCAAHDPQVPALVVRRGPLRRASSPGRGGGVHRGGQAAGRRLDQGELREGVPAQPPAAAPEAAAGGAP